MVKSLWVRSQGLSAARVRENGFFGLPKHEAILAERNPRCQDQMPAAFRGEPWPGWRASDWFWGPQARARADRGGLLPNGRTERPPPLGTWEMGASRPCPARDGTGNGRSCSWRGGGEASKNVRAPMRGWNGAVGGRSVGEGPEAPVTGRPGGGRRWGPRRAACALVGQA
jgi:hypothetical protein